MKKIQLLVAALAYATLTTGNAAALSEEQTPVPPVPTGDYPDRLWLTAPETVEDDAAFLGDGIFCPLKVLVPELGEVLAPLIYQIAYKRHPPVYAGGAFYGYDTDVGTRSLGLHADVLEYRFRPEWAGDWAICIGIASFGPGNDCSQQPSGAAGFLIFRRSFTFSPVEW